MNGQKVVQTEQAPGAWKIQSVERAGSLKPGIYNLYKAQPADHSKTYSGNIVHADKDCVFQEIDRNTFIVHDRKNFDKVPELGSVQTIRYQMGDTLKAVAREPAQGESQNRGQHFSR